MGGGISIVFIPVTLYKIIHRMRQAEILNFLVTGIKITHKNYVIVLHFWIYFPKIAKNIIHILNVFQKRILFL